MTLSSESLRTVEFREGWRGYNQVDVDVFLEEAAAGVDMLHAELAEARVRAERAEGRVPGVGSVPETDETVRRTLALAQRAADLVVGESKAVAERILADAHLQAGRIAAEAEKAAAAIKEGALLDARQASLAVSEAASADHERALVAIRGQRLALDAEIVQRRHELDETRELTSASRDRLHAVLTDHLARLDRLDRLDTAGVVARSAGSTSPGAPIGQWLSDPSASPGPSDGVALVDVTEVGVVTR